MMLWNENLFGNQSEIIIALKEKYWWKQNLTISRWSDFLFLLKIAGIDFWLMRLVEFDVNLTFWSDTLRPRREVEAIAVKKSFIKRSRVVNEATT